MEAMPKKKKELTGFMWIEPKHNEKSTKFKVTQTNSSINVGPNVRIKPEWRPVSYKKNTNCRSLINLKLDIPLIPRYSSEIKSKLLSRTIERSAPPKN